MASRDALLKSLGIAALGFAAPLAQPAKATDWDSVAGWDVYEIDSRRCVVGRIFAEGPTTFGIILSLDGETRLFATRAGWRTRAGASVPARIALDGQPIESGSPVGLEQSANRGFVAAAPAGFLDRFAAATQLGLGTTPGQPNTALPLTGSAAGLAQGRRCLENLREEARTRAPAFPRSSSTSALAPAPRTAPVRFAANAPRVAASPPLPRKPRANWVTAEDYPDAALRAEEEGSVTVKLAIDRSGEVAGCDVVRSSGSATLDSATCKTVRRRARYQPAVDSAGQPIPAFDNHTVRWSLPR